MKVTVVVRSPWIDALVVGWQYHICIALRRSTVKGASPQKRAKRCEPHSLGYVAALCLCAIAPRVLQRI